MTLERSKQGFRMAKRLQLRWVCTERRRGFTAVVSVAPVLFDDGFDRQRQARTPARHHLASRRLVAAARRPSGRGSWLAEQTVLGFLRSRQGSFDQGGWASRVDARRRPNAAPQRARLPTRQPLGRPGLRPPRRKAILSSDAQHRSNSRKEVEDDQHCFTASPRRGGRS
jgi:hypothetical protein